MTLLWELRIDFLTRLDAYFQTTSEKFAAHFDTLLPKDEIETCYVPQQTMEDTRANAPVTSLVRR
jgi:hypothetical protein